MSEDILFYAQFTALGNGANGLTVTWDVDRINRADGTRTALVTGAATSIVIGRHGLYGYRLVGADTEVYDYIATAITADLTVDCKEVVAVPTILLPSSVAISSTVAAAVSIGNLAIEAACTLRQSILSTTMLDLSSASKLWLAIKDDNSTASDDSDAIILVEKTAGITVVNRASYPITTNGSLTVSGSAGAWSVDIYLDEAVTVLLFNQNKSYNAAIKAKIGGDEVSIWGGRYNCLITDGIVRTI